MSISHFRRFLPAAGPGRSRPPPAGSTRSRAWLSAPPKGAAAARHLPFFPAKITQISHQNPLAFRRGNGYNKLSTMERPPQSMNLLKPVLRNTLITGGTSDMNLEKYLDITPELQEAIKNGEPVVALESTILSHGMPYPENLSFCRRGGKRDPGLRRSPRHYGAHRRQDQSRSLPGRAGADVPRRKCRQGLPPRLCHLPRHR